MTNAIKLAESIALGEYDGDSGTYWSSMVVLAQSVVALQSRQQELLATIVRVTNETPFSDEAKDALEQRGKLVAEIGTLRSQLAASNAARDELVGIADRLLCAMRVPDDDVLDAQQARIAELGKAGGS